MEPEAQWCSRSTMARTMSTMLAVKEEKQIARKARLAYQTNRKIGRAVPMET